MKTYCHCFPVFGCEPACAETEDLEHGYWIPVCDRCMQIAWQANRRVRKLQANCSDRLEYKPLLMAGLEATTGIEPV